MEFVMLCGLPGSGKSYEAKKYKETHLILSSDVLREELNITEQNKEAHNIVFNELNNRLINSLKENKNVVYDATNLHSKYRINLINNISKFNPYKRIVVVATTFNQCVENNNNRKNKVPNDVITRMLRNFSMPQYYEGWDEINIVYPFPIDLNKFNLEEKIKSLYSFNQENTHHTLSLGEHCQRVADYFKNDYIDTDDFMYNIGLLHDLGKEYTKSFITKDKKADNNAHYIDHEYVSSYLTLFYLKDKYNNVQKMLDACLLIENHMCYHNFDKMKPITKLKFQSKFSKHLFKKLELLCKSDSLAK